MTALADLLAGARRTTSGMSLSIPPGWMQGRTSFGGLSSAVALDAAQRVAPDLPPLRSAQIAFVGPLSGTIRAEARLLRRGRTAAFVSCDVIGDAGLGLRATFVFMAPQASRITLDRAPRHRRPAPQHADRIELGMAPAFAGRFDFADVPDDAPSPSGLLRWVRLRDRDGLDPAVALIAVADALPPAAFPLLEGTPAPLSSVTWMLDLLTPAPATDDGWWLLESRTDHVRDGGSSQAMRMWNAAGDCVAEGLQSVAIFA